MFRDSITAVFNNLDAIGHKHVRFGLIDDPDPTNWSPWLISPVDGWFEIELYGPFSASTVRSCEIKVTVPLSGSERASLINEGFTESADGVFSLGDEMS